MTLTHTPAYTTSHPDRFEDKTTGHGYEVSHDDCAEDPRSWNEPEHAGLWAYREPHPGGGSTAGDKPVGNVAIDAFAHYYDTYDAQKSLLLTRRYLAAFHPDLQMAVETHTIRGYSQGDWLDLVVAVADGYGTPAHHADTYRQWAFGDVWFVQADDGKSLGGIYADGPEEAVTQFRAQYPVRTFVRTLSLTITADDDTEADNIAAQIISAIHESDALPTGVRAAMTEPPQES